jgi:hypothetical protein
MTDLGTTKLEKLGQAEAAVLLFPTGVVYRNEPTKRICTLDMYQKANQYYIDPRTKELILKPQYSILAPK